MKKLGRILGLALLFCLAVFSGGAETAGPTGETVTGYFADHTYLRPAMKQTTDSVDVIPPYTVVTLQVIDETWAQYTGPKGKTGYVKYARIQPEPEYEPEEERYVYGEKRIGGRSLPIYDSPTVYTAAAWELLTVDGHWKGYLHVRAGDGTAGRRRACALGDCVSAQGGTNCGSETDRFLA